MEKFTRTGRNHPQRKCPFCKEEFVPKDARQQYCCRKHQTYYNNDLRKERQAGYCTFYKKLKHNRDVLLKAWLRLHEMKEDYISMDILRYEEFDFKVYTYREVNTKTGLPVYWVMEMGIEAVMGMPDKFRIHFKN